jgi:membrane-bound serine protease (ClpP class)
MKKILIILLIFSLVAPVFAQKTGKTKVFVLEIKSSIDARMNRYIKDGLQNAEKANADYILMDMDTFGGTLYDGDLIRQQILNFKKPVLAFVNKNAASAGSLIAIACDSIYMAKGANMGAATVVNGLTGAAAPDKYQSYMRSIMRSTAAANHRDPRYAEGMVDEEMEIDSLKPLGRVITFTTNEAIKYGYCEGEANSIEEVLKKANIRNYEIKKYEMPFTENIIAFFMNPIVSGILILCILGGLYFELQSPGLGLPIIVALTALTLLLVPYYLSGLAANWEIAVFVVGVILLAIEIFAIPGFGVTGISGLILIFTSLVLMMLGNDFFDFDNVSDTQIIQSLLTVLGGMTGTIVLAFIGGRKLIESQRFKKLTLQETLDSKEGYNNDFIKENLIGSIGTAFTVLRPSGKVMINGSVYDASAKTGFIDQHDAITVVEQEGSFVRVKKV